MSISIIHPKKNDKIKRVGKFKRFVKRFWPYIITLSVIVGLVTSYDPVRKLFMSKEAIRQEEEFEHGNVSSVPVTDSSSIRSLNGIKVPPYMFGTTPTISFQLGTNSFGSIGFGDIENGIDINEILGMCDDKSIKILLKVTNYRLFFSAKLYDLHKEEYVGEIKYNHWEVYKANRFEVKQSDSTLEIIDLSRDYLLRMKFKYPNILLIQGYFVGNYKVLVFGDRDNCFNLTTEKRQAAEAIKTINNLTF